MAVDESGNIFVGGRFTSIDNVVTYNIARYDIATDSWSALAGNGLREFGGPYVTVEAMAIKGNDLFVGGRFSETFDGSTTNLTNIARYDLAAKAWHPLTGGGIHYALNNGNVNALAISGNDLYVGGLFKRTADDVTLNLNNIARYNFPANPANPGTWTALTGNGLGQGFSGSVSALAISGNGTDLFVGGEFTQSHNGTTTNLNNIARYALTGVNANTWSALAGNGLSDGSGGFVSALAISGNDLFVGGSFTRTHNGATLNLNNIARFDIGANGWFRLAGNGLSNTGFGGYVFSLAIHGSVLYVGGIFSQTADGTTLTNINRIARYAFPANPATLGSWSSLQGTGLDSTVSSIAIVGNQLFVGGLFKQTANGVTKNLNSVARYQISFNSWSALGPNNGIALDDAVNAVAVHENGNIYVGGSFTKTLDGAITNLNHIARFNVATNAWEPLAASGLNGNVHALEFIGDNLYVGGDFTMTVDGVPISLNRIARYNTVSNTWFPLTGSVPNGNGLNNSVFALEKSGDNLYIGGTFMQTIGDTPTTLNRIGHYNNATNTWSPLTGSAMNGNGLNNSVHALAVSGNNLFVGGMFSQTFNGEPPDLNHIARYDIANNTWAATTHNGLDGPVYALYANGSNLLARGDFTQTFDGEKSLDKLAHYDISNSLWTALPDQKDEVYQAATLASAMQPSGTDLAIGGTFEQLSCGPAKSFTRIYFQQSTVGAVASSTNLIPDWHNGANWTMGTVPAANSNAVIGAGAGNVGITSADVTMNDFMLNGGTLTIGAGRTLTINGILGLNGGTINGPGTVVITNCKQDGIMGGDAASYIQTSLVRCVNNTGTFNFPVGTANGYSPVTVRDITGTGNILVKANQGAYTATANGLPVNRLGRWWQVENTGGGVTSADLVFNYLDADVSGPENSLAAYRISGGTATSVTGTVNTFSNRVFAENVNGFSDWTLASNTGGTPTPTATPTATPTPTPSGFEGDVAPRTAGDGAITSTDVVQLRRFVAGLDVPNAATNEAQRADCAPFSTRGDGVLTSTDVIQGRRYASGLDPLTASGGPLPASIGANSVTALFNLIKGLFNARIISTASSTAQAGTTVSIPVEIVSAGDELAVSFTVDFDPTKLKNVQITLVDEANSNAVLTANQTIEGRLGVLIDYADALPASVKPRQIATITFDIASNANGTIPLDFSGSVAAISISNAAGESVPVQTLGGTITVK